MSLFMAGLFIIGFFFALLFYPKEHPEITTWVLRICFFGALACLYIRIL